MRKIFLYLYPIEEFYKFFLFDEKYYQGENREHPLSVLNKCIQKRYKEKGYQIVLALYPDKEIYGIHKELADQIIYTDISFNQAISHNEEKNKYPNEQYLIDQLESTSHIVIGGFHFSDCVKKVANACINNGIDTLIDLELTDLFFAVYYQKYFQIDNYSEERYKAYLYSKLTKKQLEHIEIMEDSMKKMYDFPGCNLFVKEDTKERAK